VQDELRSERRRGGKSKLQAGWPTWCVSSSPWAGWSLAVFVLCMSTASRSTAPTAAASSSLTRTTAEATTTSTQPTTASPSAVATPRPLLNLSKPINYSGLDNAEEDPTPAPAPHHPPPSVSSTSTTASPHLSHPTHLNQPHTSGEYHSHHLHRYIRSGCTSLECTYSSTTRFEARVACCGRGTAVRLLLQPLLPHKEVEVVQSIEYALVVSSRALADPPVVQSSRSSSRGHLTLLQAEQRGAEGSSRALQGGRAHFDQCACPLA
jgi:hypothetical protein